MVQKAIWLVVLLLFFTSMDAKQLRAEGPATSNEATAAYPSSKNDKISLAEVAPELYYQSGRYPKFYGDENTIQGSLLREPIDRALLEIMETDTWNKLVERYIGSGG